MSRLHQTKPKRRRCRRHSPTARHGADGRETRNITDREVRGFFAPVAGGGLDLSGAGLKAKRVGHRTV
ncbi:hypothetical protein [Neisseria viridiae]|uniref:hypothetical protein n=1 Tax=Neisseria viridiae TaxID=2830648 RepID=UPI00272BB856|nr:hypothetical protein [Neisseria viridiae]